MLADKYSPRVRKGLELAALVDVVLLLLAYFLLNASLHRNALIKMELPGSSAPLSREEKGILISIESDRSLRVNGAAAEDGALPGILKRFREKGATPPVRIRAHRRISYGTFIGVMDRVREAGFSDVRLETLRKGRER